MVLRLKVWCNSEELLESSKMMKSLGLSYEGSEDLDDYVLKDVYVPLNKVIFFYPEVFCGKDCVFMCVDEFDFLVDTTIENLLDEINRA